MAYERPLAARLLRALRKTPALIHILNGPRQVGKTTAALAIRKRWKGPSRYAAADELLPPSADWIATQWQLARRDADDGPCLLVLDEIQKVDGWSDVVKGLWDADRRSGRAVVPLLLGSSALLLSKGAAESLAGRFLLHRCLHWSWPECRDAFGWDLERWLFFGGYPGAASFADDLATWRAYVRDSLIEAVLARDVLCMQRVTKPALLRHLFGLACRVPAQPLSYNKMLGQLQEAGNATTLAGYGRLLETAYLLSCLDRYSGTRVRSRGSTPKLVLWSNALVNAVDSRTPTGARKDPTWWGRLVENAAGAHLLNHLQALGWRLQWWRDGNHEVDFVVETPGGTWALEVKSGRSQRAQGLEAFRRQVPRSRSLIIGPGGMGLEEFFACDPAELLSAHAG